MAGHSAWKNIQHRKGAQDKKRGKIFTKILKEITVAVKTGGGPNIEFNPRLRLAVQNARGSNMPRDTIERAIKKASGEGGENYSEATYECYGPEGAALFVECMTDNPTRTVSNVRSYLNKFNGSLGKDGSLQFIFERKGVFEINEFSGDEDEVTLSLIDAGADDVVFEEGKVSITCPMESFGNIQKALADLKIEPQEAGLERIPLVMKKIEDEGSFSTFMKLVDALEEDDDVQKVYHNVEFDEKFAEKFLT